MVKKRKQSFDTTRKGRGYNTVVRGHSRQNREGKMSMVREHYRKKRPTNSWEEYYDYCEEVDKNLLHEADKILGSDDND